MWYIASYLPIKNSTLISVVMTAGSSPLIGAAAIGKLLRLNNNLILAVLVCSTILTPITLPFIALKLLNLEIGVNAEELIFRLGTLIGTAGLAARPAGRRVGSSVSQPVARSGRVGTLVPPWLQMRRRTRAGWDPGTQAHPSS